MEDLLIFLESYCTEDQKHFWTAPSIYNKETYHFSLIKDNGEFKWGISSTQNSPWQFYSKDDFLDEIRTQKIDLLRLESELTETIKLKGVYANMLLQEATKLVGQNSMSVAIKGYEAFSEQLLKAVREALDDKKQDSSKTLRIVKS